MGQGGGRQLLHSAHLTSLPTLQSFSSCSSSSSSSSSSCRASLSLFSTRLARRGITSPRFGEEWFTDDEDEPGGRGAQSSGHFQNSSNSSSAKFSNHRDFEHAFGEEIMHSAGLEEITNRQLRRKPVGRSRALALFGTSKLHDPGDKSHLPRDSGKPRFRLHNLKRDEGMIARYGILESVMKEIRTDREESLQRKRQRMEKERQLRARDQASFIQAKPSRDGDESFGAPPHLKTEGDEVKKPWSAVAADSIAGGEAAAEAEAEVEAEAESDVENSNVDSEAAQPKWTQDLPSPRMMFTTGITSSEVARPQIMLAPETAGSVGTVAEHQMFRSRLGAAASVEAALAAGTAHVAESGTGLTANEASMLLVAVSKLSRSSGTPDHFLVRLERLLGALQTRDGVATLSPKELRESLSAMVQLQAPLAGLRPLLAQLRSSVRSFETGQLISVLFALSRLSDPVAQTAEKECEEMMDAILEVLGKRQTEVDALKPLQVLTLCLASSRLQLRAPWLASVAAGTLTAEANKLETGRSSTLLAQDVLAIVESQVRALLGENFVEAVCHWWTTKHAGQPVASYKSDLTALCQSFSTAPERTKRLLVERLLEPVLQSAELSAQAEADVVSSLKDAKLAAEALGHWKPDSGLASLRSVDLANLSRALTAHRGSDSGGAVARAEDRLAAEVAKRISSFQGDQIDLLNLAVACRGLPVEEGPRQALLAASGGRLGRVSPELAARLLLALEAAMPSLPWEDLAKSPIPEALRSASREDFGALGLGEGVSLLCSISRLQKESGQPGLGAERGSGTREGKWMAGLAEALAERVAQTPSWKLDYDELARTLETTIDNFDALSAGPGSALLGALLERLSMLLERRGEAAISLLTRFSSSESLALLLEVRSRTRSVGASERLEEAILKSEAPALNKAEWLATLGCDGLAMRRWLQRELGKGDRPASQLCHFAFLSASAQANPAAVLACADRVMTDLSSGDAPSQRALLKLAWAGAVAGAEPSSVNKIVEAAEAAEAAEAKAQAEAGSALERLAQRQLAAYLEANQLTVPAALATLLEPSKENQGHDQGQTARASMRKALQQLDVFFEVRPEAFLLPESKLALLFDAAGSQKFPLLSGSSSGFAVLPMRRLEVEGWRSLDLPTVQNFDDFVVDLANRLSMAAPAHYADLPGSTAVTRRRQASEGHLPSPSPPSSKSRGQTKFSKSARNGMRKRR